MCVLNDMVDSNGRLKPVIQRSCSNVHRSFENFKKNVREKGGIWASDCVRFTQYADGFSAVYKPDFPEHSPDDCAILYGWDKDEWIYMTPETYDAMYNKIRNEVKRRAHNEG